MKRLIRFDLLPFEWFVESPDSLKDLFWGLQIVDANPTHKLKELIR